MTAANTLVLYDRGFETTYKILSVTKFTNYQELIIKTLSERNSSGIKINYNETEQQQQVIRLY